MSSTAHESKFKYISLNSQFFRYMINNKTQFIATIYFVKFWCNKTVERVPFVEATKGNLTKNSLRDKLKWGLERTLKKITVTVEIIEVAKRFYCI